MNWKQRSAEKEELDDLEFSGPELEKSLDELSWVHNYLGGRQITLRALKRALSLISYDTEERPLHILDAGCGGGDSLRTMAKWSEHRDIDMKLTGIDGNPATIEYARKKSVDHPAIHYKNMDLFSEDVEWEKYDIVFFALILHHFSNDQIKTLLDKCANASVPILVINDLHRHPLAHSLFTGLTKVLDFSHVSRVDGLRSIQKAFVKTELRDILTQSGYTPHHIRWQWAFRFEAIGQLNSG